MYNRQTDRQRVTKYRINKIRLDLVVCYKSLLSN